MKRLQLWLGSVLIALGILALISGLTGIDFGALC